MDKTNAMRILDQKKITYEVKEYPHKEGICVDGLTVAEMLEEDPKQVFKTLVGHFEKKYYVCVIPVGCELDLKKAAQVFRIKRLELIPVKELLPVTGYIRGGCSPIGMKKSFPTLVDISAFQQEAIIFSGGKIGYQIKMNPKTLAEVISLQFADIVREDSYVGIGD